MQADNEASSSDTLAHRLSAYVQPLVENRDFSGVIRIIRGEQLLFEKAWGYADFEQNVQHSVDSRFAIASLSKTVTAAAIINLKAEGKISYEDLLSKHLPGFTHGNKIRIKHLLRFESGLAEIDSEQEFTSQALLDEIGAHPLAFEPGTESKYGNSGFDVMAILVEHVSQMSFEDYLRSTFFEPLNMTSSGLRRELGSTQQTLVSPHRPGPPPSLVFKDSYFNPFNAIGAGGLYATAKDLSAWGLSLARKEIVDLDQEEYPWGWGTTEIQGHKGIMQTGMQPGFTASLQVFPDEELVIVMLNNIEAGMWVDWAKDLARIVFLEEPLVEHEQYTYAQSLPEGAIESLPGRYELNSDRFVDVKAVEGHLWLYLNDYHVGRYMLPLTDGGFQLRDFTGRIYFNRSSSGEVTSFAWKLPKVWNASDETYVRTNTAQ